jgi:hypothetical protein
MSFVLCLLFYSRLCDLVFRVPGYISRGPGFDSRRYKIFWEVVGLERGSLSLVSITEELLGRNTTGSGVENREYGRGDPLRWPRDTLYPQKLALTSLASGGRSVGIVRLRTNATEFDFVILFCVSYSTHRIHLFYCMCLSSSQVQQVRWDMSYGREMCSSSAARTVVGRQAELNASSAVTGLTSCAELYFENFVPFVIRPVILVHLKISYPTQQFVECAPTGHGSTSAYSKQTFAEVEHS